MQVLRSGYLAIVLGAVAVAIVAAPHSLHAEPLKAGVAVVDITPPLGYRMSGYFYERLNTGTLDPLKAKAVVFEQGDERAALVICDLIALGAEVTGPAREAASQATGIPAANIAITATHSHTGPLYAGTLRDYFHEQAVKQYGHDPHEKIDYVDLLKQRLVEAVTTAHKSAQPVSLQAGTGLETRLSFNRRFHLKNGTVQFNPGILNPNILYAAGPIDPQVNLLRIKPEGGEQDLALLTVFALHLDTVSGTEYSADYPYHLEKALREKLSPDLVSLFGTGTCGDINHIDVGTKKVRGAAEIGTMLAENVLETLDRLTSVSNPSLAARSTTVSVPTQEFTPEQIKQARERLPQVGSRNLSFIEQVEAVTIVDIADSYDKTIPLEVQAFRLSPDLAIVTLPGEVFVELGLAIKRASPFETTMVIELANTTPAYIPTRKAFGEGSYETVNSRAQPGAGEAMVEGAVRILKELKAAE